MHDIEPHYNWRSYYVASEDERSPFYGREYSEFEFTDQIYNYLIHPQWDSMGSPTLFIKILYADYDLGFAVIELIGEWNDLLNNDIMFLKRDIIEIMLGEGVNKYVLVGENVLNFHYSDDCYYEEWFEEVDDGWIVGLNFREHVVEDMQVANIDYYIDFGGEFGDMNWRTYAPHHLFYKIDSIISKRLGMPAVEH